MATNIAKLKSSKGAPPPADETPDVISQDLGDEKEPLKPLQVRIPKSVFKDFSARAGREFGFNHGAKKANVSQNVGSIQGAKHLSMLACI